MSAPCVLSDDSQPDLAASFLLLLFFFFFPPPQVHRLLDMETYNAGSMTGWLDGDGFGGDYVKFIDAAMPRDKAGPGLGYVRWWRGGGVVAWWLRLQAKSVIRYAQILVHVVSREVGG